MKIIGISILMFIFLTIFSLSMDILLGFDLNTSINNAIRPFLVMEVAEQVIFFLLIVLIAGGQVRAFYNKRKQK
ncbi:hypothetical protein MKX96_17775 [Psychrobacillus sp. FSL W7-1493]|uniref:hypothetical protein n=1 Tax=Psychrobacillus sp. FSL W7-1493 TaxID=2921552 RepID=UPI0030F78CFE